MRPSLDEAAVGHDEDLVHVLDGAQSVGDGDGRPAFLGLVQGLLDHLNERGKLFL